MLGWNLRLEATVRLGHFWKADAGYFAQALKGTRSSSALSSTRHNSFLPPN
jgi:hypothetical protein